MSWHLVGDSSHEACSLFSLPPAEMGGWWWAGRGQGGGRGEGQLAEKFVEVLCCCCCTCAAESTEEFLPARLCSAACFGFHGWSWREVPRKLHKGPSAAWPAPAHHASSQWTACTKHRVSCWPRGAPGNQNVHPPARGAVQDELILFPIPLQAPPLPPSMQDSACCFFAADHVSVLQQKTWRSLKGHSDSPTPY